MTDLGHIINRIKAHQARVALEGLQQPKGTTGFDYGHLVGRVQGLEEAVELVLAMVNERDEGEQFDG